MIWGKFIAFTFIVTNEERAQIKYLNSSLIIRGKKDSNKSKVSRKKEINIIGEIKETEMYKRHKNWWGSNWVL